ncbi:gliding motility protein GldN [bacterium]|nr:gliding motility protein GldN [bacterium]
MRLTIILFLLAASTMAYAQESANEALRFKTDFTYQQQTTPERKAVPYPQLREADVLFCRRVERIMDTREKQNSTCRWEKNPLSYLVFVAAERGEIVAYSNEQLTETYRADTVIRMFATSEVVQVPDPKFPDDFIDSVIYTAYPLEDIVHWKIIEDWVFDSKSGQFVPRIVAIAPMINLRVAGQDLGEVPAFYIKWSEARKLFVNEPAFNAHNSSGSFTYYDFFERRMFSSHITKVPNVQDLSFENYEMLSGNALAQLLEAQKAQEELMNFESDLWQY